MHLRRRMTEKVLWTAVPCRHSPAGGLPAPPDLLGARAANAARTGRRGRRRDGPPLRDARRASPRTTTAIGDPSVSRQPGNPRVRALVVSLVLSLAVAASLPAPASRATPPPGEKKDASPR